jgi:8-oxo-dGTP diphosphatase
MDLPFIGTHAIPGGFVHQDESLEDAALRELYEETGVHSVFLEQLYSFGDPKRDPRGRVITVAYYVLISSDILSLTAGPDAAEADWFPSTTFPRWNVSATN